MLLYNETVKGSELKVAVSEEQLKKYFSNNLCHYRKALGLTQIDLAEKLNYSDKSVSKWERGDGLPDLVVTKQIADIFGLTVNDLIAEKPKRRLMTTRNKTVITLLSIGLVWLAATVVFFLCKIISPATDFWWMTYIYAIPVSAIVGVVFSNIWWKKPHLFASITVLIWSCALCIMLTVNVSNIYLIFIVAAVLQILTMLGFSIKKQ